MAPPPDELAVELDTDEPDEPDDEEPDEDEPDEESDDDEDEDDEDDDSPDDDAEVSAFFDGDSAPLAFSAPARESLR